MADLPCSPIFGFYGDAAVGDYELAPQFNFYGSHYLGFDKKERRLVQFDININYMASDYQVIQCRKTRYSTARYERRLTGADEHQS